MWVNNKTGKQETPGGVLSGAAARTGVINKKNYRKGRKMEEKMVDI